MARHDPTSGDPVRHAVALFRRRGATAHDKRSAVVALAGVLEERRQLLKAQLLRGDEGALFPDPSGGSTPEVLVDGFLAADISLY